MWSEGFRHKKKSYALVLIPFFVWKCIAVYMVNNGNMNKLKYYVFREHLSEHYATQNHRIRLDLFTRQKVNIEVSCFLCIW